LNGFGIKPFIPLSRQKRSGKTGRPSRHATDPGVAFVRRIIVPHLAVVGFTVIAIILILIFVRFRFDQRLAKLVNLALDVLIVVFLITLIFVCLRFSTS